LQEAQDSAASLQRQKEAGLRELKKAETELSRLRKALRESEDDKAAGARTKGRAETELRMVQVPRCLDTLSYDAVVTSFRSATMLTT
jgi:hypothetical protein